MSGVTGLNVSGTNLGNGVNTVASKPIDNTSSQKPAENNDKKMSTGMKVGIGAVAVAASVIAGIAIKNKIATKSLEKATKELENAAKKVGLDVKSYMAAKKASANGVSKIENVTYEDMYNRLKSVYKSGIASRGDSMTLTHGSSSTLKEIDKNFPDNSILFTITRGEGENMKIIHSEVFLYDHMADSLKDMIGNGKTWVQKLE